MCSMWFHNESTEITYTSICRHLHSNKLSKTIVKAHILLVFPDSESFLIEFMCDCSNSKTL